MNALDRHIDAREAGRWWRHPPDAVAALVRAAEAVRGPLVVRAQERFERSRRVHDVDYARRIERFESGLAWVRQRATERAPMDWPALQEAQRRVLGLAGRPAFRTTPAHTPRRATPHPWYPSMAGRFRDKLRVDASDDVPGVVRAVRGYLDVIFVHPFVDGNARAGRLMLEYGLRRHGLPTPDLDAFVRLPKRCGDTSRYWGLCRMLARGVLRRAGHCPASVGSPVVPRRSR